MSWYAYQLTLAWLHILRVEAYDKYCQEGYGPHEPIDIWEKRLITAFPTIFFWTTIRDYMLICCRFVRGQWVGDWPLTLSACNELCPWFFAFGHTNYARRMPVILWDMAQLPEFHPLVHQAFLDGKFVVQRADKKFSVMAPDQGQEHNIKFLEPQNPNRIKRGGTAVPQTRVAPKIPIPKGVQLQAFLQLYTLRLWEQRWALPVHQQGLAEECSCFTISPPHKKGWYCAQ